MYTLGHQFMPSSIHAGGLRYHGASVLCSQLLKDGLIEAVAMQQLECFEAGVLFAQTEGILPAPEAAHAIAQVIREAAAAKEAGESRTILFNLCGHGHFDLQAYSDYFDGKLSDHTLDNDVIRENISAIDALQPA
jgi:tryptophan synthase beta chain